LADRIEAFAGRSVDELMFMGRIGEPRTRKSVARSTRLPLEDLTEDGAG
jgi:hypothetical protein